MNYFMKLAVEGLEAQSHKWHSESLGNTSHPKLHVTHPKILIMHHRLCSNFLLNRAKIRLYFSPVYEIVLINNRNYGRSTKVIINLLKIFYHMDVELVFSCIKYGNACCIAYTLFK